ncbi:hypothetical protein MUK42_07192, partial [Musa troglodytarum]
SSVVVRGCRIKLFFGPRQRRIPRSQLETSRPPRWTDHIALLARTFVWLLSLSASLR